MAHMVFLEHLGGSCGSGDFEIDIYDNSCRRRFDTKKEAMDFIGGFIVTENNKQQTGK